MHNYQNSMFYDFEILGFLLSVSFFIEKNLVSSPQSSVIFRNFSMRITNLLLSGSSRLSSSTLAVPHDPFVSSLRLLLFS